jgi:hypothetical protein
VKYAIPVGTLILLGLAAALQRASVLPAEPPRQGPLPEAVLGEKQEPTAARDEAHRTPVPQVRTSEPVAAPRTPAVPSWRRLYAQVDRSLMLTSSQQGSVQDLLRERENEIRECHSAIRTSGLLDIRDYEWKVARMKESWYRRIDALLDGIQHERFVALVSEGLFNDGLAFTIEPGMTVLD